MISTTDLSETHADLPARSDTTQGAYLIFASVPVDHEFFPLLPSTSTDTHVYRHVYATTSPQTIPTMLVIWRSSQLPFHFESVSKMSNKRSSRPRSSAESEATKPVSIVREMEDIQVDHPHTGSIKSETPKAIKSGIDLARKLFHRPHDEQLDTSIRVDRIFYVHTTNEQHELRRRATEEDLRLRAKLDISRPIISPPPPDVTLMHRYRRRQTDWRRCSLAMKTKHVDDFRSKRWSLKIRKVCSGRDLFTQEASQGHADTGNTVELLPVPLEKKAPSFRDQNQSGRERVPAVPRMSSPRWANLEISVKHSPQLSKKRSTTFRDQRWGPLSSPTALEAIDEQPTLAKIIPPSHRHASNTTNIPRLHEFGTQMPRKSASTSMLRPPTAYHSNFTAASQQGASSPTDQRHTCPPLRSQSGSRSSAAHRRHNDPTFCTQPSPASKTFSQRNVHPLHRTQPSVDSTTSLYTVKTATSNQSTSQPIPRVRITPPSTVIDPDKIAIALAIRPPGILEQMSLLKTMNDTRKAIFMGPLDLHPLLSLRVQDYVTLQLLPIPPPKPTAAVYKHHMSMTTKYALPRATQIEKVEFLAASSTNAIRLISPPGMGALACGELWAGGKYKRHKTVKPGQVPAEHRFTMLPDFELDIKAVDKDSMISMVSRGHDGTAYCGCAEYDAYVAVTDKRWKSVGIGRARDGRWVVELWEPAAGAATSM
jgi:hypothetical protein